MNNILKEFLIIAILVIAFLYILQKNKNEHIDNTVDNLTAKTITATGDINTGSNINANNIKATGSVSAQYFTADNIKIIKGFLCLDDVCINKEMLAVLKVKAGYGPLQM